MYVHFSQLIVVPFSNDPSVGNDVTCVLHFLHSVTVVLTISPGSFTIATAIQLRQIHDKLDEGHHALKQRESVDGQLRQSLVLRCCISKTSEESADEREVNDVKCIKGKAEYDWTICRISSMARIA